MAADDSRFSRNDTPARASWSFEMLKELELTQVDIHLSPITNTGSRNTLLMAQRIAQIDRYMRRQGLTYTLNQEAPVSSGRGDHARRM